MTNPIPEAKPCPECQQFRQERDEAIAKWHAHQKNVPCPGCEGGHDTYWKSVVESPQWREWSRVSRDFDTAECEACGHISERHFQAFLKFVIDSAKPPLPEASEAKAEAFEEAAKVVWDWTYRKRVGGADVDLVKVLKGLAAALRTPQSAPEKP
jgi:hypothetical protein